MADRRVGGCGRSRPIVLIGCAFAGLLLAVLAGTANGAINNTLVPVAKGSSGFGNFRPGSHPGGDDDALRRALGEPSEVNRSRRYPICVLKWRRLGVRAELAVFGTGAPTPCKTGIFVSASLTDRRWHTASGVRPGGAESVARRASKRRCKTTTCGVRGYALELHRTECSSGKVPGVIAAVPKHSNRVEKLIVRWRSCE